MFYVFNSILTFMIDFLSKSAIKKKFEENKKVNLYKNKIFIYHIKNKGIAYGFFKNYPIFLYFLVFLSFFTILFIFLLSFKSSSKLYKTSVSFALGGAFGNFYDRIKNKSVTDFIYIKYKNMPIFNFADIFLVFSVILMFFKESSNCFKN